MYNRGSKRSRRSRHRRSATLEDRAPLGAYGLNAPLCPQQQKTRKSILQARPGSTRRSATPATDFEGRRRRRQRRRWKWRWRRRMWWWGREWRRRRGGWRRWRRRRGDSEVWAGLRRVLFLLFGASSWPIAVATRNLKVTDQRPGRKRRSTSSRNEARSGVINQGARSKTAPPFNHPHTTTYI